MGSGVGKTTWVDAGRKVRLMRVYSYAVPSISAFLGPPEAHTSCPSRVLTTRHGFSLTFSSH